MTATHETSPLGAMKPCLLAAVGTGGMALVAARAWFPTTPVYWGILAGWAFAAINYVTLIRIIARLINPKRRKLLMGALLSAKMLGVLLAVFLVLKYLPVDGMAFAIGYLAVMMGVMGHHFIRSLAAR